MSNALTTASANQLTFGQRYKLAEMLVSTGFLPVSVKSAAQALAIIETGRELGIGPMHALRSIHVIQGKPTLSAELQLGLFKAKGGRAEWRHSDAERAVIWLRHPNGDEHEETFTIEDARRAGITSKDGWKNYPKAMLRARASSAGLRAVAPDIVAGLYDPEEMGADVTADGEIVMERAVVSTIQTDTTESYEEPGDAREDEPAPRTQKQNDYFNKLNKSSVWTDEERGDNATKVVKLNAAQMIEFLDTYVAEFNRRKLAQKEAKEKADATA